MYYSLPISRFFCCIIIPSLFFLSSCMRWEEGWKQFKEPTKTGDVTEQVEKAKQQFEEAETKEDVLEFIKTAESILEIDPYNYEALRGLGGWYYVFASLYTDNEEEKKKYYLDSIRYCEQGMYTNPQFRDLVDKGEQLWDACRVLSKREMPFMYYWYTSCGGYWLECLNPISRMIQLIHAGRTKKVLARMMEIDPAWAGGHPYCASALGYAALPRLLGGDLEKAEEFFDKAIEAGPNWLYIKFARATVLYTKTKDKEAFKRDLEWVLAQDPHKADSPYPANVWFQAEAKEMLANIDEYF